MRISVKESEGKGINIVLPTGMVLNRLTAAVICRTLRKHSDLRITSRQAMVLIKEVKRCKRRNPGWNLVEVKSSDGDDVLVRL